MPKFILEIELGNDAMKSDLDIAIALRDCAERIEYDGIMIRPETRKNVVNINGNKVGYYEVRK